MIDKLKIHLMVNYYVSDFSVRQKEINKTLIKNIKNKFIDKIHVLIGDCAVPKPIKKSNKIKVSKIKDRLSYDDFFKYSKEHIRNGDTCIIANADIFFDETISNINNFLNSKTALVLTRHDKVNGKWRIYAGHDSQDAWCYINPIKKLEEQAGFCLGNRGCDNRIAYILKSAYRLRNPAKQIKIYHNHKSGIRTYSSEVLRGGITRIKVE